MMRLARRELFHWCIREKNRPTFFFPIKWLFFSIPFSSSSSSFSFFSYYYFSLLVINRSFEIMGRMSLNGCSKTALQIVDADWMVPPFFFSSSSSLDRYRMDPKIADCLEQQTHFRSTAVWIEYRQSFELKPPYEGIDKIKGVSKSTAQICFLFHVCMGSSPDRSKDISHEDVIRRPIGSFLH